MLTRTFESCSGPLNQSLTKTREFGIDLLPTLGATHRLPFSAYSIKTKESWKQRCNNYGPLRSQYIQSAFPFQYSAWEVTSCRLFFRSLSRALFGSMGPRSVWPAVPKSKRVRKCNGLHSINHTPGVSCFQTSAHRVQARVRSGLASGVSSGLVYIGADLHRGRLLAVADFFFG
jgi:hypothetical protein